MTPATALRALDRSLSAAGTPIAFTRQSGGGTLTVPAAPKGYSPEEMAGAQQQGLTAVAVSPAPFSAAGWVPVKGDKAVYAGKTRIVEAVDPVEIAGRLVRLNITLKG